MADLEFTVTRRLTEEQVKEILTTAIEGGIGYWSILDNDCKSWEEARETCKRRTGGKAYYCDTAYELLSTGKYVRLIDSEAEDYDHPKKNEVWDLTWDKLVTGCKLWEDWSGKNLAKTVDKGDFDATCADVLIQLALFGEIIYG